MIVITVHESGGTNAADNTTRYTRLDQNCLPLGDCL